MIKLGEVKEETPIIALSDEQILELQTLLNDKGYMAGDVDGILGPKTKAAWAKFKTAKNLNKLESVGPSSIKMLEDTLPIIELVLSWEQAKLIFPAITTVQYADLLICLKTFKIDNTKKRIAHFLAQCGHESGGLKWLKEIASGSAYEYRKDLGNTQPGDGPKYKGAGAIQLTGRFNYGKFSKYIGDPAIMGGCNYVAKHYPFTSAGFFWLSNDLNHYCDIGYSVEQITRKVNGGLRGLSDRINWYNKISKVLGLL